MSLRHVSLFIIIFFFAVILEHQIELPNMPERFGTEGLSSWAGWGERCAIQEADVVSEHGLLFTEDW